MKRRLLILFVATTATLIFLDRSGAAGVQPSKWVYPSYIGDLLYGSDPNGVRINDFSECGYMRGEAALPEMSDLVPTNEWIRLTPLGSGQDNSVAINNAIVRAGTNSINAHGFRGVVYLEAGEYRVDSTIWMTNSGVVLKGAGSSSTTGTRLKVPAYGSNDIIAVAGGNPNFPVDADAEMVEFLVPAGTRTFPVARVGDLKVGRIVSICHLASQTWLHDIGMDHLVQTWIAPEGVTGNYERQVTRIEGNWVTVDSPLPQTFEQHYGGGTLCFLTNAPDPRVVNCGVEDLACLFFLNPLTIETAYPPSAVNISAASDVWVRNVAASGYIGACVTVEGKAKFITVAECQLDNPANATFHDRYAFRLRSDAGHVLVRDCFANRSRHSFVTESTVPGPNAFVRCVADNSLDEAGPHQRWSTGLLLDQVDVDDGGGFFNRSSGQICIQNRGNSGGGHSAQGWTGAYSVVWNCSAEEGFRVRLPPTAVNWLIGSPGTNRPSLHGCAPFGTGDCWAAGIDPDCLSDQSGLGGKNVQLRSLYYAQLQQRFKAPASEFREYRLGAIDQFSSSGYWDDRPVPVDPYWFAIVSSMTGAPNGATNRFDTLRTNCYTAFSFIFPVATNEQIVAASITLGLRLVSGGVAANQRLYLGNSDLFDSFNLLGWNVTDNASSVHTALIVPGELQDGQLNVAVGPDCGVDFAVLHLQVAPVIPSRTTTLNPIDTFVRGGNSANSNFSASTQLEVKDDNDAEFTRRAFLHWNLGEEQGGLVEAKVRLFCIDSAQAGNEQSASLIKERGWSPNSVTWNTQPAEKPPLAYWTPEPGTFVEFTVTPEVRAALTGDKQFMIALKGADDFGSAGLVSYASSDDPDPNPAHRPQLILRFTNSAPTIVAPPDQFAFDGTMVGPLPITIGDGETTAGNLTLTAHSEAPAVIHDPNIMLFGSGSNRQVMIDVPPGSFGQAPITLTVSDGVNSVSTFFTVSVNNPNSPPSISSITNQTTDEDVPLTVAFTVSDPGTQPRFLTVTALATNNLLLPPGSIQVSNGITANRWCVFTPAPDRFGTTTVSVAVSDGSLSTTQSFVLAVRSVEDAPTAVQMESPRGGANLIPNAPAIVRASAFDAETNIVRFDFYRQDPVYGVTQLIAVATNAPYSSTWSNPPAGDWNLYAVATDQTGLTGTSPPVAISVSVPEITLPWLAIGQLSNSVVVLWPENVSSNALKTTTNLSPPILWSPLPSAPMLGEGAWIYELAPTDRQRFFKLIE